MSKTLREQIDELKARYKNKEDWEIQESLGWILQDHFSSKGCLCDFSADDWAVLKENDFNTYDVEWYCGVDKGNPDGRSCKGDDDADKYWSEEEIELGGAW